MHASSISNLNQAITIELYWHNTKESFRFCGEIPIITLPRNFPCWHKAIETFGIEFNCFKTFGFNYSQLLRIAWLKPNEAILSSSIQ